LADDRDGLWKALRLIAPGTSARVGLDSIVSARTGALIVVGDSPQVMKLVDGGFRIDTEFLPSSLYELAKMDGAIILSHDFRRILYANATLIVDPSTPTYETGIRHRSGERAARQTGELVICISQRRTMISLYKGSMRYVLRDSNLILTKANQALQTLEKYRAVLDRTLNNLACLEFEDTVSVMDVALVMQRFAMVLRVVAEIDQYICELGTEGRLVSMQLTELVTNLDEIGLLVIRDYLHAGDNRTPDSVRAQMENWSGEEMSDLVAMARMLGLGTTPGALECPVSPKGFRLLRRIPRLPLPVIEKLVNHLHDFQRTLRATIEELDEVEGIGGVRARAIKEGLRRLREQVMLERQV
jgi:diadenylate cyclase